MTDMEQRAAAAKFAAYWKGRGYEKGESQSFWTTLLADVLGVEDVASYITFEEKVKLDNTSFIDGIIPATHVLIEQKSIGKDLRKPIKQSDGTLLTPFQQAKRYSAELPYSQRPRWIVTCNFQEFHIYDMERPTGEPESLLLENLGKEYYRLNFLVTTGDSNIKKEKEVSLQAGKIVGVLYDALLKQYQNPESPHTLKSLNALCVRLVFCLYAEDAGVFGKRNMFHDYLNAHRSEDRRALINLFHILDKKPEERDPYLDNDLKAFPYVNGGLFADENIEIPRLGDEIIDLILKRASADFDWSGISPTIFGAVFESTIQSKIRRSGGMHYTSIENIHKVIDPLFLNDLQAELEEIKAIGVERTRDAKLRAFQQKLAGLRFLDPACGSGNFLTETYLSLRRMENEVIAILNRGQIVMDIGNPIQVSIGQFYGIEINDFAVTVARTALWIAESQMIKETMDTVHKELDFLPLKTAAHIVEGNALRMDWESVVPKHELNYIMGNPPFVGQALRSAHQSDDMLLLFGKGAPETKLDYVVCWYQKAADYMEQTKIKAAFISTNSLCQGESVPTFWKTMHDKGIEIQFAVPSFPWLNEGTEQAAVFCVIVGFSAFETKAPKLLYTGNSAKQVEHINGYLLPAPDIWLKNRTFKRSGLLNEMTKGSEPTDGGNLFLTKQEKDAFLEKYPGMEALICPFVGGREFLENKTGEFDRYCFWLKGVSPAMYVKNPDIVERLKKVKAVRMASSADRIRKRAEYPYLFCQDRQPSTKYLVFPRHTTANRRYIPIGYLEPDVIIGDACYIIADTSLYHFGVLTSNVHMAWMRTVCGRLGMGYRYSPFVYNNFPWPNPTDAQKATIEKTAQAILDARASHPDCSLATLYDELAMPPELRKAHQDNDRAVMDAYGFVKGHPARTSESQCVAELMKLYQALAQN